MKFHDLANVFPEMTDEEFQILKGDIEKNGLRVPILIHGEEIIDGKHRYKACQELGVEPKFEEWNGEGSLVDLVVSLNSNRRHLTASQKAVVALDILPYIEKEAEERMRIGSMALNGEKQNKGTARLPEGSSGEARTQAGEKVGVGARYVSDAKKIKERAPQVAEAIKTGKINIPEAKVIATLTSEKQKEIIAQVKKPGEIKKIIKANRVAEIAEARTELAKQGSTVAPSKRWQVEVADMQTYTPSHQFDFIITDPPYLKKYLHLYTTLAKRSLEWLKPNGLLLVMCGQSYLHQIITNMSEHLSYYWIGCYSTPGQPTPLRQRQVNTNWKPILIFGDKTYNGKIFSDVWASDNNEKDFHKWGQSESGMYSLIKQVCLPGQTIFDPFCGAGTTGVAALKHGCLFHGIDLEEENVNISRARLGGVSHDTKTI